MLNKPVIEIAAEICLYCLKAYKPMPRSKSYCPVCGKELLKSAGCYSKGTGDMPSDLRLSE
jgi:predicted amidophosphoribosyltransferase